MITLVLIKKFRAEDVKGIQAIVSDFGFEELDTSTPDSLTSIAHHLLNGYQMSTLQSRLKNEVGDHLKISFFGD